MSQLPSHLLEAPAEPVTAVIALGSNLGQSQQILADAVAAFRDHDQITVTAVSPLALTAPVGGIEQPDFLNQVLLVNTLLSPWALLQFGHRLERQAARVRDIRWGPRTLDVDVITYDDVVSEHPDLVLPHPRAHERAFVLIPWSWADPQATLAGTPVVDLASAADDAATVIQFEPAPPRGQGSEDV
ncbi:MAG TPA: 2-amino-4-hydroxy-6-hydroxymethyldihydropteridine diphosphokinase [Enteractinococcus sp.]